MGAVVIVDKDQAWANEVWIQLLADAGLKCFALVTAISGLVLGSKITSRGLRHPAIVTEQAAEASGPLDLGHQ
jgi:hypothetical protein